MPNRSLDDFVGGGEEETDADASDAETEAAGETAPEPDVDTMDGAEADAAAAETDADAEPTLTVEAATPTYDFSPDGSVCEACGETVETRWHADEVGMVCAECKRWD